MSEFFFENDEDLSYSDQDNPEPSNRLDVSQPSSVQGSRSLHKNKYINKMRQLGADEKSSVAQQCSAKGLNKKERNKVSAKQSRDRKKLYIQILEERQKALSKQLQTKKKQLEETKGYLQRVVNQNKTVSRNLPR